MGDCVDRCRSAVCAFMYFVSFSIDRKHYLTIFRSPYHLPELIEILEKLSHEEKVMSLHSCSKGLLSDDQPSILHQCFGSEVVDYPDILRQSRYCLIVHELRYGSHQLLDALMSVSVCCVSCCSYCSINIVQCS